MDVAVVAFGRGGNVSDMFELKLHKHVIRNKELS